MNKCNGLNISTNSAPGADNGTRYSTNKRKNVNHNSQAGSILKIIFFILFSTLNFPTFHVYLRACMYVCMNFYIILGFNMLHYEIILQANFFKLKNNRLQ